MPMNLPKTLEAFEAWAADFPLEGDEYPNLKAAFVNHEKLFLRAVYIDPSLNGHVIYHEKYPDIWLALYKLSELRQAMTDLVQWNFGHKTFDKSSLAFLILADQAKMLEAVGDQLT